MTDLDADPRNPFRPLDWRWRRASRLAAAGLTPSTRRDDRWVRSGFRYLAPCPTRRRRLRGAATIESAMRLRSSADPRVRHEVEARLLAGQDAAVVDDRLGLDPGVAATFEALFYAVSGRLRAGDLIATLAIGPAAYRGDGSATIEILAKQIAYAHGPLAIDAMVRHLGWPGAARTPPHSTNDETRLARLFDTLIGAMRVPVGAVDALLTLRLAARVGELERRAAERRGASLLRSIVAGPHSLVDALSADRIGGEPDHTDHVVAHDISDMSAA